MVLANCLTTMHVMITRVRQATKPGTTDSWNYSIWHYCASSLCTAIPSLLLSSIGRILISVPNHSIPKPGFPAQENGATTIGNSAFGLVEALNITETRIDILSMYIIGTFHGQRVIVRTSIKRSCTFVFLRATF